MFKVQNLACSSHYGINKPPIPLGKSQPPLSLWYGTNRTSRPQKVPGLAKKTDGRNEIKEQAGTVRKTHGTFMRTKRNIKNQTKQRPLERFPPNQCEGGQAPLKRDLGALNSRCVWQKTQKEEGDSAMPSSQRQAALDRGLQSPEGEEVVVDTSEVVGGTSQKGEEAVGCQPMRPCEEEMKDG